MPSYETQLLDVAASFQHAAPRYEDGITRARAQLTFAQQLCAAHPERAGDWRPLILEAGRAAQAGLQAHADPDALTAQAEATLAPLAEAAKSYTLLCVGHAHIDMNWQWSWPETVALTHDTFQTMLALMDEFPQFVFSQSQASVYALIERYNPAMFAEIQRRVQEGRWEITASQWVEGDKNMASGESISRHLLYTRAYVQEKFGLGPEAVRVDFEPDTFGHPATLPTILARGGVRYYYHCRGSRGPHLYWWIGPDGSRLLVFHDIQWYMHFDEAHHVAVAPNMADPLMDFAQATGLRAMPVLYGVGDHGGGPTRRDLRRLIAMDAWPIYPNVRFSTLQAFYEMAEARAENLPEIAGERNFVFRGCYSSQARQKEANRHGENLLYAAEAAAALGARLAQVPYPQANLEGAWRHLLFDQFHDILPGSGVRATRHYTLGHAQDAQAAAGMARTLALRALAARVDTASLRAGFWQSPERGHKDAAEGGLAGGAGVGNETGTGGESAFSVTQTSDRAFLIFNALAFPRTEVVTAKLWDTQLDLAHLAVTGAGLKPQPVQVLGQGHYAGHRYTEIAFPVAVPALGYRAVCVSDRRVELGLAPDAAPSLWDGTGGAARTRAPIDATLENEHLALRLDPASGSIVSLVDKRTGRQWVPEGDKLGVLHYGVEAYEGMSAWVIGQFKTRQDLDEGGKLTPIHNGPHVRAYRWTRRLGETTLELEISLRRDAPRVEFRLRVDWREMGDRERGIPHLRVRFPLALRAPRAHFEVPFGSVERRCFNGEEVPAQRWVTLAEPDGAAVTLTNTSKYGFSVEGHALGMTLLRASIDPDPLPDLGEHVIDYALEIHPGSWTTAASAEAGERANVPLTVTSCDFHGGEWPPAQSLVSVAPENVRLAALKRQREGDGLVLRLVEVNGEATEARITLGPALLPEGASAVEADTLERPLEDGTAQRVGDEVTLKIPANGITTLMLL